MALAVEKFASSEGDVLEAVLKFSLLKALSGGLDLSSPTGYVVIGAKVLVHSLTRVGRSVYSTT